MTDASEELGARWQSERCPECAFDPNGFGAAELPAAVAALGRRYQAPLTRLLPGEDASLLVAHPLPGVWSALAYACHVRDVLSVFDRIKVCVAYEHEGKRYESFPPHQSIFHKATPVYEELAGWRSEITGARSWNDLPLEARAYVERIEALTGVPVTQISVGAEAKETVTRILPAAKRRAR